jgi:hypothetical protein
LLLAAAAVAEASLTPQQVVAVGPVVLLLDQ